MTSRQKRQARRAARHLALYGEHLSEEGILLKEQVADVKKNKEAAPKKAKKKGLFSKKG